MNPKIIFDLSEVLISGLVGVEHSLAVFADGENGRLPPSLQVGVFFEIGHLSFLMPTPLFDEPNPSFRSGFVILLALMAFYFVLTLIMPRRQSLHD